MYASVWTEILNSELHLLNFSLSVSVNTVYTSHVYIGVQEALRLCQERITGFRQDWNPHLTVHVIKKLQGFLSKGWPESQVKHFISSHSLGFIFVALSKNSSVNTADKERRKLLSGWEKTMVWEYETVWLAGVRRQIKYLSVRWGKPVRLTQCCWDTEPEGV